LSSKILTTNTFGLRVEGTKVIAKKWWDRSPGSSCNAARSPGHSTGREVFWI